MTQINIDRRELTKRIRLEAEHLDPEARRRLLHFKGWIETSADPIDTLVVLLRDLAEKK